MKNKKTLLWLCLVSVVFLLVTFSFSIALAAPFENKWALSNIGDYGLPDGTIGAIIIMLTTWLVGIFAFFGIAGFIISGIMYLVSTGNDDMISKAKKYMTYSLVGVIVGISGYVIIKAVDAILRARPTF